jgi:hypothetical protein
VTLAAGRASECVEQHRPKALRLTRPASRATPQGGTFTGVGRGGVGRPALHSAFQPAAARRRRVALEVAVLACRELDKQKLEGTAALVHKRWPVAVQAAWLGADLGLGFGFGLGLVFVFVFVFGFVYVFVFGFVFGFGFVFVFGFGFGFGFGVRLAALQLAHRARVGAL